ncbi:hypothetical protein [Aeromicrobium duanguangcaii]|uniref:Uncharacterized protein n=1 Tax=Aeromicrobium duanguangcaii TaxID=2968086 RepID=A0ABY5KI49_9ACTN|nr:hypothetical protein [Aeromicrobium duanguangcaii]MCD9153243.1 hypothetical protein [Aeromicrobium duanguangcaii]UUI69658.1 hypothetical protein NP095_06075 [Aeromicrobium duanguangcaii]
MAAELQMVTRFHPDAIAVPGDPDRLRHGAERLQDLVAEVKDLGQRLRQADAPKESRGPTVRALSRVAGMLGRVLEADADQLTELSELVRRQGDRLTDAHAALEDTRRRWRQARQELRTEIDSLNQVAERAQRERAERRAERERAERERAERERAERGRAGNGERIERGPAHLDREFRAGGHHDDREIEPPTEAGQIIRAMDQQVLDQFEGPLRRLTGLEFTDRHGAMVMPANGKVEQAAERYRQSVDAAFEDLVEALRPVNRLDQQVIEQLPRHEKAIATAVVSGGQEATPDPMRLSRPDDIATVGEQIQDCARAIAQLGERLPEIRLSIREGRMTPEDERVGSMNGFQRTWKDHFEQIREDLAHACRTSSEIATQLRELDERGAREIRRTFRAAD